MSSGFGRSLITLVVSFALGCSSGSDPPTPEPVASVTVTSAQSSVEPPPIQWTGKCLSFSSVPHPRWSQKLPLRQRRRGVEVS